LVVQPDLLTDRNYRSAKVTVSVLEKVGAGLYTLVDPFSDEKTAE